MLWKNKKVNRRKKCIKRKVNLEVRWMNLEPVIQSEVSQKKKSKFCILMHMYMESRKIVLMNQFAGKE